MKNINVLLSCLKNKECFVDDWQNNGMYEICKTYYVQIGKETQNKTLSVHAVWGYLRHIPREKITKGYRSNVYEEANKCLCKLYRYSKDMGYISTDTSIDDFLYKDWYHNTTTQQKSNKSSEKVTKNREIC